MNNINTKFAPKHANDIAIDKVIQQSLMKSRRDKRRTHYKASSAQIATDKTTGQDHLYHRAHWHEGKLYYRGKVLADTTEESE